MDTPAGPRDYEAEALLAQLRLTFETELARIHPIGPIQAAGISPEGEHLRGHETVEPEEPRLWLGHDPADPSLQVDSDALQRLANRPPTATPEGPGEYVAYPNNSGPEEFTFSAKGEKYLAELAAASEHISDTETGPMRRTEFNSLFDRNEEYLRQVYDQVLSGDTLDIEKHDRFMAFAERSVDAILRPQEYRAPEPENERAPEAIERQPAVNGNRERTDAAQEKETRAASHEMTDAAAGRQFNDLGEAMRHEAEQSLQRPGRGMSLGM